jgi:hypothetical protein
MKRATKNRLGGRLAASQFLGTVAGLLITGIAGQLMLSGSYSTAEVPQIVIGGLIFSVPFYAAAVLVLHNFAKSILANPLVWCVGIPGGVLLGCLIAFPPSKDGVYWIDLIPFCALCSGMIFFIWQRKSPLEYVP